MVGALAKVQIKTTKESLAIVKTKKEANVMATIKLVAKWRIIIITSRKQRNSYLPYLLRWKTTLKKNGKICNGKLTHKKVLLIVQGSCKGRGFYV
jgi:hypothetical protein